jgi:hypothetical protein
MALQNYLPINITDWWKLLPIDIFDWSKKLPIPAVRPCIPIYRESPPPRGHDKDPSLLKGPERRAYA